MMEMFTLPWTQGVRLNSVTFIISCSLSTPPGSIRRGANNIWYRLRFWNCCYLTRAFSGVRWDCSITNSPGNSVTSWPDLHRQLIDTTWWISNDADVWGVEVRCLVWIKSWWWLVRTIIKILWRTRCRGEWLEGHRFLRMFWQDCIYCSIFPIYSPNSVVSLKYPLCYNPDWLLAVRHRCFRIFHASLDTVSYKIRD